MGELVKLKICLSNLVDKKIKYRNSIFTVKKIFIFPDSNIKCVSLEDGEGYIANFDISLVEGHFEII